MLHGVYFELGVYGRRAIITAAWTNEMTDYLLANEVVELELNDGKGWQRGDLAFLAKLPHLQSFTLIDLGTPSDEPIHFLHELRQLSVVTYCTTEIRFSAFPKLEDCALEWRPKAKSVFDCTTLRELFVNRYKGQDVCPFENLVNLESLAILNGPIKNLHGLRNLKKLRSLRLAGLPRLGSLAGIESLTNLEELDINTCKAFGSIAEIGALVRLKKLEINNDGHVQTLKPLNNLSRLESVGFYESTNIVDGDLSPLTRQKHLTNISFQNRRHYSHRREDFGAAYFGAGYVKK